uniref:Major facilitator superfamily (MFS) profile domain-containing protein n=1 Tax=Strigamia maritima TaxID=126957 RepID=T1J6X6_STRMM
MLSYDKIHCTFAGWLGVMSLAISLFLAPFVVAFCRRKSTRLTAVFGGLVMALACLFTSFAQQMHQVFFSYGVVMGIGVGLTRETSNLMVGQYFKRRREFIEIIVQSGGGIGIALFSVFLKESINSIGWRLGLQAVTGTLFLCFILGIFYRSASLYHPQRRAILHLKSQKRKIKDKSKKDDKPSYCDFTALRTRTLQIIMLSAATSALGLYTPLFFLILQGTEEGLEASTLILLQTFVGFAFAVGCVAFGLVVVRQSEQCMISRQYLCQTSLFGLGVSILALTAVQGYHGYVVFVWIYGIFLGGYHYTLKMFTLERARARFFSRAWGFVQWAQAVPVLIGVPISGYINDSSYGPKSGYYLSCTFTLAGASSLFLLNLYKRSVRRQDATVSFGSVESRGSSSAIPQLDDDEDDEGNINRRHDPRLAKSISFATSVDVIDGKRPDCLTCISEEGLAALGELYGREEITSCNKVEKYLLISEYKNNLMEETRIDQPTPSPPPPPLQLACPAHGNPDQAELARNLPCRISQRNRLRSSITVVEEMTTSMKSKGIFPDSTHRCTQSLVLI